MHELAETGDEEDRFDPAEHQQHQIGQESLLSEIAQIDAEQERGHQHGNGDGESVGRFHAGTGPEVQHHEGAADPEQTVDGADVELPLGIGGIADFQVRQEVQQNCLRHQCIGAGDERL